MTRLLYGLGRFCVRHRLLVVMVWFAALIGMAVLARQLGSKTSDNYTLPATGAQKAQDVLTRLFPQQEHGSSPIVFHTDAGMLTDAAHQPAMEAAFRDLKDSPLVEEAIDPLSKQGRYLGMLSDDERTAFISVILKQKIGDVSIPEAERLVQLAQRPAEAAGIQVAAGGILGGVLSQPDPGGADRYGLLAAMVILALVFGSLTAMGVPIITALFALGIGLSTITILSHAMDIPTVAPTVATMIGLGVGIDYALFTVTRHRDHLRQGMHVKESIARATATSGGAIVFAGATVLIAIASLGIAGIPLVSRMGYTTSIVVAICVIAAITLLPSVLTIIGPRINALRMPRFLRPRDKDPSESVWARWADWVGRHPWTSVAMALAVLIPLTLPLFRLTLGSPDVAASPKTSTDRAAYDLLAGGFGPGANGPLLVSVELDSPAQAGSRFLADQTEARSLGNRLRGLQSMGISLKDRLTARGNALRQAGIRLAAAGAPLQIQQARLEAKGRALLRQKAVLQKKGAALLRKKAALERKGAILERRGTALGARLQAIGATIAVVQAKLAGASDPNVIARLTARLGRLQARAVRLQAELARIQAAGARLQVQAEKLAKQGAALQAQGARLAAAGAALQAQGAALARQGAPLLVRKHRLQEQGRHLRHRVQQAKRRGAVLKDRVRRWLDRVQVLKRSLIQQMKEAGGKKTGTDPRLTSLRDALVEVPGVESVSPIQVSDNGRAAVITVTPTTDPADPRTTELVRTLRQRTIPEATNGNGTRAYVGGLTAAYDDLAHKISGVLPVVIATVIGLSFLLLMIAFRSIAIPVKAALMNVLSVAAAYGVLVAVFQWGWGLRFIGITGADHVPIVSFVPLMMFAVLFGLSMDYEVFLMSQIVEHHATGESNHDSVVHGLASSARVITAAALIMVAVFGSFLLNENPIIKEFGIGLSVAVALDATIIRILLVPASMTLLGDANWWLPRWLAKVLPRLELEGKGYFHRMDQLKAERQSA